jgi:hypothetical protein
MKQLIIEIAKRNPEGFTIEIPSLKPVTSGYISAYLETQNSFGYEGLDKVINHAINHGKVVGGWLDTETNLYYFDSSKVFENLKEAIEFGKQNKQIAIFDLNELKTIRL